MPTYFDTNGIVFSNDDQIIDFPEMSPNAGLDEIREQLSRMDRWRRNREQLAGGGFLAKMVTFRDLIKFGLLDLALSGTLKKPEEPVPSGTKYQLACSDLTSDLEPNAYAGFFRVQSAVKIAAVSAWLLTPSTSGAVEITLWVNGDPMLSTNITIDENEGTSLTAAVQPVILVSNLAKDDEIIVEIVDPGASARGLNVGLMG